MPIIVDFSSYLCYSMEGVLDSLEDAIIRRSTQFKILFSDSDDLVL